MVLPVRHPPPDWFEIHNRIYKFWSTAWGEAFSELGWDHRGWREAFFRQDEILTLFSGDGPVGVLLLSWADLRLESFADHRFWTAFSEARQEFHRRGHDRVMRASALVVHPEWRIRGGGPPVSRVLAELGALRFLESRAVGLLALTRSDWVSERICRQFGGIPVIRGANIYNTTADVYLFERATIKAHPHPETESIVNHIWRTRTHVAPDVDF